MCESHRTDGNLEIVGSFIGYIWEHLLLFTG